MLLMIKQKFNISKEKEKVSKHKEKLGDKLSSGRFATLYEADKMTLSKELKETIANLSQDKAERKDFEMLAKVKKKKFYHLLCLNIQTNFPLDNSLLANLVYIDLSKIDSDRTKTSIKAICEKMSSFLKDEIRLFPNSEIFSESLLRGCLI